MYTNSDEEGRMWRQFISAWWQRFHAQSVQVADLYMLATEADMLAPVLGDKGERAQRTSLGRALMRMRDRVIGDHRIQVLEPDHRGVQRYRLETVGSGDPEPVTDLPPTHTEVNRQSAQRSTDQNVSDATVSTATADLRRLLPVPGLREQPKDRQRTAVEAGVGSAWPTPPDSSEKSAEVGGGAAPLEAHGVHAPDSAADVAASSAPTDEKSAEEGADLTEVTI
jgi:hypothetical protein